MTTKNPIIYQLVELSEAVQFVHLRLSVESQTYLGDYKQLIEMSAPVFNGSVTFYLNEALDKAVRQDLPNLETPNTATPQQTKHTAKRYKLSVALQDANTHYLDLEFAEEENERWAVAAAFSLEEFATKGTNLLPNNNRIFLTNLPYLLLDRDQQAFLTIFPFAEGQTSATFTIYLDDDSQLPPKTITLSTKAYQPLHLPIGFAAQNYLQNLPTGRSIKQINLTVFNQTIQIQTIQNFFLQNKIEIHYANTVGGWDSFVCTGQTEQTITAEKQTHQHYLLHDYHHSQSPQRTYQTNSQRTGKIRSGFLPMELAQVMATDLVQSPQVLMKVGKLYLPITINTKKLNLSKANEYKGFFEVEYEIY